MWGFGSDGIHDAAFLAVAPLGDVGSPVAADAAGPVDGGLDVDADQTGQSRKFLTMRAINHHRRWS
jgi:hypothetical protein